MKREVREWMEFAGYLVPANTPALQRLWPTCECGAAMTPTDEAGIFLCPFEGLHLRAAHSQASPQ
jgi:hypothetical protein